MSLDRLAGGGPAGGVPLGVVAPQRTDRQIGGDRLEVAVGLRRVRARQPTFVLVHLQVALRERQSEESRGALAVAVTGQHGGRLGGFRPVDRVPLEK